MQKKAHKRGQRIFSPQFPGWSNLTVSLVIPNTMPWSIDTLNKKFENSNLYMEACIYLQRAYQPKPIVKFSRLYSPNHLGHSDQPDILNHQTTLTTMANQADQPDQPYHPDAANSPDHQDNQNQPDPSADYGLKKVFQNWVSGQFYTTK